MTAPRSISAGFMMAPTCLLIAIALAFPSTFLFAPTAAASVNTVVVEADSYVQSTNPDNNHGSESALWVDGSPVTRSYLRFQVGPDRPAKAVLRLYITRSSAAFEVRSASSAWNETSITYASAPEPGSIAVPSGAVSAGNWAEVDVTSLVTTSGPATFVLTGISESSQAIATRESESTHTPQLLVTPQPSNGNDVTAPTVTISSPRSGATISTASVVDIQADASDNVGVTAVQFFDNGIYQGQEDTAPFRYAWRVGAAANGTHRWTAVAQDAAGNAATSTPVDVTVAVAGSTPTPSGDVTASVETTPVPHTGDAADDAATWVAPADPSRSTVIGTDKRGGLAVYDLSGRQLYYYADGRHNNVDIRYNVPLGGRKVDLVVSSEIDGDALRTYVVDPATRALQSVDSRTLGVGIGLYGLCLYRSPTSDKLYAFNSDSSGTLQQWELFDNGSGKIDARKVRQISVGSTTEGCTADDEQGRLFLAEEDVAIWSYNAEPSGGTTRTKVDAVGAGRLDADIEGLTLYHGMNGTGYLIASSQGSNSYAVYDRRPPYAPVTTFSITAGDVDAVTYTDGIDISNVNLGTAFPEGMFIAQDDSNDGNQNFKLVPWSRIAGSTSSPLLIDTEWNPRSMSRPSPASGHRYHVDSTNGSDSNSGLSPTEPFRSLAKVGTVRLNPGDQVLLARGRSWSERLVPVGSGSSEAPVLIGAYGSGEAPVVGRSSSCVRVDGSYVVVQDLHVTGCSWAGIVVVGSHNVIRRNGVTDTAAGVYVKSGATDNIVVNNQLTDNNRMSVLTSSPSSDDSGAFGVLLRGDRTEVAGNVITGSDAFSYDYGRDGAAIEVYNGVGNHIHHNIAVDNHAFAELGGSRAADNTFGYNEVRSALATSTFLVTRGAKSSYGPVLRTRLINNTAYLTGTSSQGFVCHDGCGPDILTMRNNVVSGGRRAGYADAAFDEASNLYWKGDRRFKLGPKSRVADPLFVNPAAGDFRLRAGSPAVDTGSGNGHRTDVAGLPQPVDGDGDGRPVTDRGAHERQPVCMECGR